MCCELRVIWLVASRKWISLVKPDPVNYFVASQVTESLLQNFIIQCFKRSWFGVEKSIVQILWFLDLFWRWEVKIHFLRNHVFYCVFVRLHGNIFSTLNTCNLSHKLSKQTTRQLSISFVIHDYRLIIIATNDSKNWWSLYAVWLRILDLLLKYLLTFGKQTQ